jgi:hypothetical protein
MFEFHVKAFKKCKKFKSNHYIYAHESWLQLKCLTLVSLGKPIRNFRDFLATGGIYVAEPECAVSSEDILDDWSKLPSSVLDRK